MCINTCINEAKLINLLFITIAGNDLGYGHLSRCLALAEHASKRDFSISFLLFGDKDAFSRVEYAGYDCLVEPIPALKNQLADILQNYFSVTDVVVADFSHQKIFPDVSCIQQVLNDIRKWIRKVVLIDALGVQALSNKMSDMPIDVLVVPYVGVTISDNTHYNILKGPAYAVLSSAYLELQERTVREVADRILVSCGGSDPNNLTALVLAGIDRIPIHLEVRVIVGPLFDQGVKATLRSIVSNSKISIVFIDSPEMLVEHMMWCDLAIATTGLIKYELAATATPGILISIDDVHELINRAFANMGSSIDLGVSVTPEQVATHVRSLLDNYETRVMMAMVGRKMIDGKGTERILTEIVKHCCSTK